MLEKLRPLAPWLIAAVVLYLVVRARQASAPGSVVNLPAGASGADTQAQINTLGTQVQSLASSLHDLYAIGQQGVVGSHTCATGEHWNDGLQRCALNAPCAPTAYWNGSYCACLPGFVSTDGGATCHPATDTTCGAGYVFDTTLQYCVPSSGHY